MDSDGRMKLKVINQPSSRNQLRDAFTMQIAGMRLPWYLNGGKVRLTGLVSGTSVSGRSVRDEEITLVDCYCLTSGTLHEPRQITFTVNLAYIGIALPATEELLSKKVHCQAEGVEGWLNPRGPNLSKNNYPSSSAEVETVAEIEEVGPTTVKMVAWTSHGREQGNTVEIRENGYIELSLIAPAGWSKLSDCLYSAYRFIRFALNSLCVIKQILVDVDGSEARVEVVEEWMRNSEGRLYQPKKIPYEALFTADKREKLVVGSASNVLRRWLEIPQKAQGALLRIHGLVAADDLLENRAVSVCGAGELWYTQTQGRNDCKESVNVEPLDEQVRTEIKEIFAGNGWQDVYSRRFRSILKSANPLSISTGRKVKRLFDPIEREATNSCEVSAKLLRLRNSFSHGNVGSKMSMTEMSRIVRKAQAILKLAVLDYLGVDWRTVAKYNKTLRWELGLDDGWHALPYPKAEGEEADRTTTEER